MKKWNPLQWNILAWTMWINSAACAAEIFANGLSFLVLWVMMMFGFFAKVFWIAAEKTVEEEKFSQQCKELHAAKESRGD